MVTINPVNVVTSTVNVGGSDKSSGTGFADLLKNAIQGTVNSQRDAEKLTLQAAAGEDVPMHEVIQAVGKAEMTLQTMLTVRDKTVEAYQEILRMPI
jgi:flagellar hook-basal body complex protein FliE